MTASADLLYSGYSHFAEKVMADIRQEVFGTDIGQNSWVTVEEYQHFLPWLGLGSDHHVLEVASGSGGPACYVARTTGCRVTGIDANAAGVQTATETAAKVGEAERVKFSVADANAELPFKTDSFDALLCVDSLNHFANRLGVFQEWRRVLRPGGRALFTDPVVVTGAVTNEELAVRSAVGLFLFVPPKINEKLLRQADFRLVRTEDVTQNAALVAERWRDARQARREQLLAFEGEERFDGLQRFFEMVHVLYREKRLSRIAYLAEEATSSANEGGDPPLYHSAVSDRETRSDR